MMTEPNRDQLWTDFLMAWPPERVSQMALDEYTNLDKNDAFLYWLEYRTRLLGEIKLRQASHCVIRRRSSTEEKQPSRGDIYGEQYTWATRYGNSEVEAFATLRSRLVEVIAAAQNGNFARVEEIDLPSVLKWKVAFLYQDRNAPTIFPLFWKEALLTNYRTIKPDARLVDTPYHTMYETLIDRHREELGDIYNIANVLWQRYQAEDKRTQQAWAVPLSPALKPEDYEALCQKAVVEPVDVDPLLENLLTSVDLAAGDQLALLVENDVRALAELTNAEPGQYAWQQTPVNFPSGLLVAPTEIRKLTETEQQEIWNQSPTSESTEEKAQSGPRYWKISPGEDAIAWQEWRDRGIISIGWHKLGDLTNLTQAEFKERAEQCSKEHKYKKGMFQVWAFRNIRPGDRIVANKGMSKVLGIGTVTESYYYSPEAKLAEGVNHPHQIKVQWDDTTPRAINKSGWVSSLIRLTKADFEAILNQDPAVEVITPTPVRETPSLPQPCEPRNVILYGPPGTGKTYNTVRRALELILGPEKLIGLTDKGLTSLFREHQAKGQIEFVTFHQAYGYEEFVEGIRPVLNQGSDAQVRYEIHDGVFKRIALRAAAEGLRTEGAVPEFDELWDMLIRDISQEGGRIAQGPVGKSYQLSLTNQGNIQLRLCKVDEEGGLSEIIGEPRVASKDSARLYWKHRAELGPEPEKFTYEKTKELFARERGGSGGNQYTSLWIVYAQMLALSRTVGMRKVEMIDKIGRVQQALDKPGPSTTFSFSTQTPQFVLIIDEINRGNMSKIFGELITLLEPDKRLTARNELKLPLSYSPQHRFAVPPNLHVLGTMNTADRSIALMDVALRRRFTFEELMPNANVIRTTLKDRVGNKAFIELVADIFETLNDRIRFLYDREHQLGHSYFLDVTDVASLQQAFLDRIVPMLQEYFYGDWDKICIVLGCPYDQAGKPRRKDAHLLTTSNGSKVYSHPIINAHSFQEVKTLGFDHDDYEDRIDYRIRPQFQYKELSPAELYSTFLGLLAIDSNSFQQRLLQLIGEPEPTISSLPANSSQSVEPASAEAQG